MFKFNLNKGNKKVSAVQLYLEMFANNISKGSLDKMLPLMSDQFQIGYDTKYSNTSAEKYYIIQVLPALIPQSFFDVVREYCADTNNTKNYNGAVKIEFYVSGKHHYIDWNSSDMKYRRRMWMQAQREQEDNDITSKSFVEASELELDDFNTWRKNSWEYVQDATNRLVSLIDTEFVVKVKTDSRTQEARKELRKTCSRFESFCAHHNIKFKRVKNTLLDFIRYISITAVEEKSLTAKTISNRILSDEIHASMCTYTPGKVNDVGTLMGVDIVTGLPVYKNFVRKGGNAENILIAGETSSGKSFTTKCICLNLYSNFFHQIILDVDGEYRALTQELNGVILDMSVGKGVYFDSIQISDLTGDSDLDATLYTEARKATASVFSVLCNIKKGMTTTEERLFSDAYTDMLEKNDIFENDCTTWHKSKKLTYHDLYREIKSMHGTGRYKDYDRELRKFIDKLAVFFEDGGLRSYLFRENISINKILDRYQKNSLPMLVDIVLNLDSDKDENRNNIEQTLKQLTATYLVTLLTNYFKQKGDFTVHYIEEYQRFILNPKVASLIQYMVTGNRKRNASTMIITNSPTTLIRTAGSAGQDIVDNITNFIIGKLKPTSIQEVCKAFNLMNCKKQLDLIATDSNYEHVFLLKINDKDTTMITQVIPQHIAESPMFKTRDTVKEDS